MTYAEYDNGLVQQFTYDDAGNRTRLVESGTRSKDVTYTFNEMNQLVNATDGSSWTYDSLGNMIGMSDTADNWEYFYSPQNRLLSIEKNTAEQAKYQYDFQGRRIFQDAPGDSLRFAWDGWQNLADYEPDGGVKKLFITGTELDEYVMQENAAGQALWFLQDKVNSVVGIVDSAGALAGWNRYETFGAILDSSGTCGLRQSFTGREIGVAGSIYYRLRWYLTPLAVFAAQDPIGYLSGDIHPYRYVWNSPCAWQDPFGLTA